MSGSCVLIFMTCNYDIAWRVKCDVPLSVLPFQRDNEVEAAGPVELYCIKQIYTLNQILIILFDYILNPEIVDY